MVLIAERRLRLPDGQVAAFDLRPLDLVSTRLKRSTETGGGIYNLTYFEQNTSTKKLSIGVRGETQIEWSSGSARPYFRAELQHNLDTPGSAEMAYADQLQTVYELDIDGGTGIRWCSVWAAISCCGRI